LQKVLDKLAAEIEEKGPAQLQPGKVTFRELAQVEQRQLLRACHL
jgi:hypothetical protein